MGGFDELMSSSYRNASVFYTFVEFGRWLGKTFSLPYFSDFKIRLGRKYVHQHF